MSDNQEGRQRLREAGLDLDRFPVWSHKAPVDPSAATQFCPYTGLERIIASPGDSNDSARVGIDPFTRKGQLVRYGVGGTNVRIVSPFGAPNQPEVLRSAYDLYVASGAPRPSRACRDGRATTATDRVDHLFPPNSATIEDVVARHGRLYFLTSHGLLGCRELPTANIVQFWQNGALDGQFVRSGQRSSDPVTELRVSETLVYVNAAEGLRAWHAGTGERLLCTNGWNRARGLPLVRLSADRVLVVAERDDQQVAAVYDLASLAAADGAWPEPLGGLVRLGPVPSSEATRHRAWAEAVEEKFVVVAADGSIWVLPFNGAHEQRAPSEGHRFARLPESPRVLASLAALRGDSGQEDALVLLLFGSTQGEAGQRFLCVVHVNRQEPPEYPSLFPEDLPSYRFPPLVVQNHLVNVCHANGESDQGLEVRLSALRSPGDLAKEAVMHGLRPPLDDLDSVCCQGHALVYVQGRTQTYGNLIAHWFGSHDLSETNLSKPFTDSDHARRVRLLWDAAGLYLVDLGAGTIETRSIAP